jgi:hypothetical protein
MRGGNMSRRAGGVGMQRRLVLAKPGSGDVEPSRGTRRIYSLPHPPQRMRAGSMPAAGLQDAPQEE